MFNSKDIQLAFKAECKEIFEKEGLYTATKSYLKEFENWKNMFIYRPRVRCDGVYFSQVQYWHDGLTNFGHYNPIHQVTFYIFLCFMPKGEVLYQQTLLEPEEFLEKVNRKKIQLDIGRYWIKNRRICVEIPRGKTTYCYEYLLQGKMNAPSDVFTLKSKSLINVEDQDYMALKMVHSTANFEFTK